MQTPIMRQLGNQIRKKMPLQNDLPPRILMALQRLADAEKERVALPANAISDDCDRQS